MQHHMAAASHKNVPPIYTHHIPYPDPVGVYQSGPYGDPTSAHSQGNMHYGNIQTPVSVLNVDHQPYAHSQSVYANPALPHQQSHPQSPENYEQDQYGQQNLADLLGELRMNEAGTGMLMIYDPNDLLRDHSPNVTF
jgi:hypothetical protein